MAGDSLTRRTPGLTPAHREFIELLAAAAVAQFLAEADRDHLPAAACREEAQC